MDITHPNDLLSFLKKLVDDYEDIIDLAKLVPYSPDKVLVKNFIQKLLDAIDKTDWLLKNFKKPESADLLTLKYIETYYTYLTIVTLPYLRELLEEALAEFRERKLIEEYNSLQAIYNRVKSLT
ncbi:hypothetical protein ACSU1N_01970 [Thermogladius sp. 4427co]|uniref:hypothetical protein n=1 Tax=Thermogladius sp. 4427co TaxID=3450718 RepID=UPI003F7AE1CB